MTSSRLARTVLGLSLILTMGNAAHADDPVLGPGRDPSGTAVAVLADGFDYTRPGVARILARDGEGEAIAWDTVDGDHRPFARDNDGTGFALAAAALGGVRIVAVRIAPGDPASLAKAVAFAVATPARIVLAPLAAEDRAGADVLVAAAQRFEQTLFVGSASDLTAGEKERGENVPNLLLLDARDRKLAVAETVARALGCGHGELSGTSGSELKRAFLERLDGGSPPRCDAKGDAKAEQR